jgi:linearmycin/streptolysin S transport system permease protein
VREGGDLAKVMAISQVNQRRAFGDRRVMFVAAALPVMLIFVIGFVSGRDQRVPLGVVTSSHGPFETRLVQLLDASDAVQVHMESSVQTERDDVLRGILLESLVIPEGFDESVEQHQSGRLQITSRTGNTDALAAQVAISSAYDVLVSEWNVAAQLAARSGSGPISAFGRVTATTDGVSKSAQKAYESGLPGAYSYTTPANLVLFVFLTLLVTSSGLVEARRNGLLRRMLASPTRPRVIVLGQLVSTSVLGLLQAAGLLVLGALVFGVRWGDPLGVAVVVIVLAVAAGGLSVLLGTLARSGEQAVAIGIVVAVALGMLGGCMWNLDTVGPLMRTVGHIAPQAWAMDAFVKLVYDHSGIAGVMPDIGVLALFAVGLVALATARLRSVATAQTATL